MSAIIGRFNVVGKAPDELDTPVSVWVDALDRQTFVFETGVVVETCRDKVSNENLFQNTASKRPDRQVTFGKIGIDFDAATDDFLFLNDASIPQDMFDGGGYYAFVFSITASTDAAGRLYQAGANINIISFQQIAGGARFDFTLQFDGDNIVEISGSNDVSLDTIHILEIEYNSDSVANRPHILLDGAALSMTQTTTPTGTRLAESANKSFGGNGTIGIDGAIYEASLFDTVPRADEKFDLRTYFADRWGATLV